MGELFDLERERRHGELMDKIGSLVGVRERTVAELSTRLRASDYTDEEL